MFQKFSLGSVAASLLVLGALLVSNSILATATLADVIANVREATSYQAKIRIETQLETGKPAIQQIGTVYWKSTGAQRMDNTAKMPGSKSETKTTSIRFTDKPGIELNFPNKTFRILPAAAGARSPLMAMEQLAKYRGDAAKDLGAKTIDGAVCYGFALPMQEVDENILGGTMDVWVAKQTDLPIEINMNIFPGVRMTTSDFEWNKPFDESIFDTAAPAEFAQSPKAAPQPAEEIAEHIIASLRIYAKHSGGEFPPVRVIYGDIIAAHLRKIAGIEGPPYSKEVLTSDLFQQLNQSNTGFAHMTVLMRESSEAEYFGKTVSPADKDAVLFRWKRSDGKLQCIYGDLSTRVQ